MDPRVKVHGWTLQNAQEVYELEGLQCGNFLDGDYTLEIEDGDKLIYITDWAGTYAPLWLPRNRVVVIQNGKIIKSFPNNVTTNLYYAPPQGLTKRHDYDAFFLAIDKAVKLRTHGVESVCITMSCGLDSGAIVSSAIYQNLDFHTISLVGDEHKPTILRRCSFIKKNKLIDEWQPGKSGHEIVSEHCNSPVLLSGLGADEQFISSDWQLFEEFNADAQPHYRRKGIQVRYPLLDFKVYQEWMRLRDDLKGEIRSQKKALRAYIDHVGFPIYTGPKVPFGLSEQTDVVYR
jgi:hypothetical protein